jgi:hypothetical protein
MEEVNKDLQMSKNASFSFKHNTVIGNTLLRPTTHVQESSNEVTVQPGESEYNYDFV